MPKQIIAFNDIYRLLSIVAGQTVTRDNLEDPALIATLISRWQSSNQDPSGQPTSNRCLSLVSRIQTLMNDIETADFSRIERLQIAWESPRARAFQHVGLALIYIALLLSVVYSSFKLLWTFSQSLNDQMFEPCGDILTRMVSEAQVGDNLWIPGPVLTSDPSALCLRPALWREGTLLSRLCYIFNDFVLENVDVWKAIGVLILWGIATYIPRVFSAYEEPMLNTFAHATMDIIRTNQEGRLGNALTFPLLDTIHTPYRHWPADRLRQAHADTFASLELESLSLVNSQLSLARTHEIPAIAALRVTLLALICQYQPGTRAIDLPELQQSAASSSHSSHGQSSHRQRQRVSSSLTFTCFLHTLSRMFNHIPPREDDVTVSLQPSHIRFFEKRYGQLPPAASSTNLSAGPVP